MAKIYTLQEGGTERLPVVQGDATRRATLAGVFSVAVPLMPERLKGNPGGTEASIGLLIYAANLVIRAGVDLALQLHSGFDVGLPG